MLGELIKNSVIHSGSDFFSFSPEHVKSYSSMGEKVDLMLRWIRLVVARFSSVPIFNFSVSFSDGRVFSYLLNHYHPQLLPRDDIREETTQVGGRYYRIISFV